MTFWLVAGLAVATTLSLHLEWWLHRRALAAIPIRIFVNGTRGKSSVTRLIAAALREAGIETVGKTTGTCARFILPDGSEVPVPRDGPPNIAELTRMLRRAARLDVRAAVFECMAVDPDLQRIAEERIMRSTITVVTNARLDHTDVQGSNPEDIAKAFAVRPGGRLITTDPLVAATQRYRLEATGGTLTLVPAGTVDPDELAGMTYVEHPENVALALAVAAALDIPREVALRGAITAAPDPGAACVIDIPDETGTWSLLNLFAANDPESTFRSLETVEAIYEDTGAPLLLFAARGDRTSRSAEFATVLPQHRDRFERLVLFGERTGAMRRRALSHGADPAWIIDAGDASPAALTALLRDRMSLSRTVVGVGNIIGPAQRWLEHLAELVSNDLPAARDVEEVPA